VPENFDIWLADDFEPATYLNQAAPVILIRGNHESCARAGTGYFRHLHRGNDTEFLDPYAKSPHGAAAQPWVVEFEDFQVGVADTSTPPSENGDEQAFADQLDLLLGHYFEGKNKPAVFGSRECLTSSVEIVFCVHVYVNVTASSHLLLHWYLPDYPYYGWGTKDDDLLETVGQNQYAKAW
jgi:hypothetical protein